MATVHKKHEANEEEETKKAASAEGSGEPKEPIVVSDTVTETAERIEVIQEVTPTESAPAEAPSTASSDPLTDFKEKMSEEEYPNSDMPQKKNFMWPILFVFIIALLLLGGIFVYKNNMKSEKVNVVTLTPTPTVMPQPSKAIDLSKYPIKILNGSGISGEASRQKSSLETEGFVVSSTGNADNSNYTKTIIQAKKEVDAAFLDKLKSVLEKSFTLADTESLLETAVTPVVIIIGSKQ